MKDVWILRHILTQVVLIVYFSAAWHGLCLAVVLMNPFPNVNCRGGVSGHYFSTGEEVCFLKFIGERKQHHLKLLPGIERFG